MKKPLIALALLALTLPLGCKVEDEPPDPLASRSGFCDAWAENACQPKVVEYCNASSVNDCKSQQSDVCRGKMPENYSSKHAKECLAAVKSAYSDGDLSPADIAVVIHFGEPCNQLSKGTAAEGESCKTNDDCNTAGGVTCVIKLGAAKGVCATPEEVGGGEACDGDAQVCADGFYCDGENCIAYKKTGKACDAGADYECSPEDHCVVAADDTTGMGACTLLADLNEECTVDADCQSGYCPLATGDTTGSCAGTIRLSRTEPLCDDLR
jgi:hypothetical protein